MSQGRAILIAVAITAVVMPVAMLMDHVGWPPGSALLLGLGVGLYAGGKYG